jgi:hypothetical protein
MPGFFFGCGFGGLLVLASFDVGNSLRLMMRFLVRRVASVGLSMLACVVAFLFRLSGLRVFSVIFSIPDQFKIFR